MQIAEEIDSSAGTFDAAEDLVVGESGRGFVAIGAERHAIGEGTFASRGDESSFEDVGAIEIVTGYAQNVGRTKCPVSADVEIEKGCEYRRAIEARPAEPVDGPIASDQRG